MGSRFAVAVIAALALAGCMRPSEEAPAAAVEDATGALEAAVLPEEPANLSALPVPVWNVGDAWMGTSRDGTEERSFVLAVTRAEGDAYVVETSDDRAAGWDAMYDMSYIGRIRASDLAGSQQGTPVQFFSFPLEDGKTWTTTWDGETVELTATRSARGYDIRGTVDGEAYVEYDFVPELKWWSSLHFLGGDYGFTIQRFEEGWSGTLVTATAKLLYEAGPMAPVASPAAASFTMDEGQAFGLVTLMGGGERWARAFYLVEPGGTPHMTSGIQNVELEGAGPRRVFLSEELPPIAGEWRIVAPSVHDPEGGFHVMVHQVAVVQKEFA